MAGEWPRKLREIHGGAAVFGAARIISERGLVEEAAAPIAFPEFPEFAWFLVKFQRFGDIVGNLRFERTGVGRSWRLVSVLRTTAALWTAHWSDGFSLKKHII
jgi:hypothetical protein